MDAGARLRHLGHRLRLVAKLLRLVEACTAILLISWSSSHLPWLAAACFRVFLDPRFVFLLGNLIVVLLFALFRHESTTSATTLPNTAYHHDLLSFTTASTSPPTGITSHYLVPPPQKEAEFEDKQAVHVQVSARAPPCRRSQSEKIGKRKKSPDTPPENSTLRRCRSENGTGRKKKVGDKEKDAEEFRRTIEEFIAKQTRFHLDESMSIVVAGKGGGDGDVGAGGEMVVHSFVKSGPLDEAPTSVLK